MTPLIIVMILLIRYVYVKRSRRANFHLIYPDGIVSYRLDDPELRSELERLNSHKLQP